MRIAQVAPLFESVPPKLYGGTDRVVSYLSEELVRQGHEVTLFASGDSVTKAHLVAACRRSLRLDKHCVDQLTHQILMLEHVFKRATEFDIVHFHIDYLHFPFSRRQPITGRDDIARPARYSRSNSPLPGVSRYAGNLDLERPAGPSTLGKLAGHGLPRRADGPVPA